MHIKLQYLGPRVIANQSYALQKNLVPSTPVKTPKIVNQMEPQLNQINASHFFRLKVQHYASPIVRINYHLSINLQLIFLCLSLRQENLERITLRLNFNWIRSINRAVVFFDGGMYIVCYFLGFPFLVFKFSVRFAFLTVSFKGWMIPIILLVILDSGASVVVSCCHIYFQKTIRKQSPLLNLTSNTSG